MSSVIQIAVATHKDYRMPKDPAYVPIRVGAALNPQTDQKFQRDDDGDNISAKNPYYSELTALYWMWKNCHADYKGLVHYRRHFRTQDSANKRAEDRFDRIATATDFERLVSSGVEAIFHKKLTYYIETMRSHWNHTQPTEQLAEAERVVAEMRSEYASSFASVLASRKAHMFNMMIMRAECFDSYCEWLFPLLFELERRIDPAGYNAFQARYLGRVSELLLDAWIGKNDIAYAELSTVSPEPVDWPKKASGFLAAKFYGKKYVKSF